MRISGVWGRKGAKKQVNSDYQDLRASRSPPAAEISGVGI